MPNPFDQFDAAAPTASAGNPFDRFDGEANPFDRFDDAGNLGGIVNAARRAGRSSLAGLDVMGAMARGAKRDDYLAEADRLETQAGQIDQLAPTWHPDNRATWATRAKSTASQLRARAQAMDASAATSLANAAQQTRKAESIPLSEDYRAYGEAHGWDAVKQFLKNPVEIPLTIAAEGLTGSVPALVAGAAGGAVAGVPGLAAGAGLGSYTTEYASTILDTLRDKGVDAEDADALRLAFADPTLMAEAKKRAVARGIPVAVFDAISGGLAGRTVAPAVKGGIKAMAKATAKEVGEQAALGMAGETAGQVSEQLATKGTVEDLNLKDIVAEGIGEIVPGFGQVATGAIARTGLNPLRKSANDKPATPPAPNPSPAATPGAPASATPSPAPATPAAPGTDLASEIGASLPDAESRDVLAGRSTEAEARKLADAKVDFGATVQSVQDALLTSGATPAQLDALDFQLRVLEERKDKRRLRPDQVNTSLANTFLFQALPPAEVFPLVSRLAADTANIQQLRTGAAPTTAPAAAPATNVSPTPAPGLTPEQRAAKLAVLQQAEQEAAAAKAKAETDREQARLKAEADQKAQAARVRAENARLATLERTGRDETGKIADLTRVPDTEMAGLDLEREGITEAQFAAEMDRRARAEERNAATAGNRGEELLDVLAQVKLPGESATLPEELRTLIREGMTAKQRMALVRAGVGELDRTAEALRGRGFIWAKTPADVIDHVQRALRGEMIYAEGDRDDVQFARRGQAQTPEFRQWFKGSKVTAPNGTPLIVYRGEHGTPIPGKILQSKLGSYTFTDDSKVAETYANEPNDRRMKAESPRVLSAHLAIKNPIIENRADPFVEMADVSKALGEEAARKFAIKFSDAITDTNNWSENFAGEYSDVADLLDKKPAALSSLYLDAYRLLDDPEFIAAAKAAGFDGAIHAGNGESMDAIEYRIFSPDQMREPLADQTKSSVPAEPRTRLARSLEEIGARRSAPSDSKTQFSRRPTAPDPATTATLAARWLDNLSLVAPGVAREVELRFGDPEQLVADGSVRASDLTGEEEAATVRQSRESARSIVYLFDRALRKNTDAVTRLNLLHEIGHLFFDTLDTTTRRTLREQWDTERTTRTGPLFDTEGNLRENVALGVFDEENPRQALHEWFAERLAHANDTWAKRRTDVRAQGDGLMRTLAAEFRAMLLKLRELLERAFGRNGYDDQLVSDFRQFLDQGDRWNETPRDADMELAGAFAKTGLPYARREGARQLTGVDFAATAADYVARNGTPAAKVDAARADIEHLLDVVADDQLDLFAYGTRGPDSARSAPLPRSDVERSGAVSRNADEAAALKNPTDSRALRTAYGIGERDAYGTTGTTRISSIIPELITDPKRTWDIRGATITTARDLVALVNVLRTPYVETTKIVFLNQSGEVVHSEIMSIGAIAGANLNAQMMARTLSRAPATVNGYDIIISHNHPSGNPSPSPADVKITRHIREVLRATPHRFRDHVVTNGDTYFSFAESGEVGFVETGAITTKKPTAAGPDAQNRAELGTLAPWEKVARGELRPINSPYAVNEIVAALRQVDPTALHIIYLNHKTNLTALERVPEFTLEQGEDTNAIIGQIFAGLGREGANQFIVAAPDVMPAHAAARLMRDLRGWANTADIVFLDFASKTLTPESTARSVGLMEGPAPQFARRTEANPEGRETDQLLRDYASLERTRDRYVSDGQTVPRHILTGLADLREALEESLPGWRNQAKAMVAEQTVTTAPSAEPEAGASALFPSDDGTVAPEETATKRSQLEASTLRRPTGVRDWLASLGRLFTNFRSAIPELPGGAKGRVFTAFRQGYRMMRAATEFTRKDAEEKVGHILAPLTGLGADAIAPETYRELQKLQQIRQEQIEAGKPIRPELTRRIAQLDAQLDAVPYHLFRKVALYRDLFFRSRLEAPNGEPLRLPFGLTAAEIETTLRDLHAKVKASPHAAQIEESLRRHYALVKEVRDGLLARGYVIPEELRNPLYFPHIVIDKASGSISRVKLDTAEDFRGYLVRLVGSERAIESDYLQAMYYHLATVEAHNARQDIVAKYWQPYDIKADLVKQAAEMNQERQARGLGPINWRQLVPEGHVIYTVDDRIPLRPEYLINRQVLAEKLGVQLGEGDLQKQLRDLGMSVTLTADDFQAALMAGEKTQWVVPKPVADALRAILDREARTAGLAERVLTTPQGLWKRWTLFAPQNVIRYTYGNMVADLEKLFSADPGVFRQLRPAMEEVRAFYDGEKPSADLRAAFERGVLDAVTVGEVTDLAREQLDQFAAFTTSRERFVGMLKRGLGWGVTVNRIREASFRYAKFKADLERQRAGAEPIYAGAYNRDVRAIREDTPEATHYARAAEISRKTFGDYADISVSGDGLRKYFIPFYSWMEVNFRYHANLFRNLGDMGAGAGAAQIARGTAAAASRILVARSATGVLLRLAVPYAAVALWNNSGDREDLEKTLSDEDRRRFHVILGKDAQGRTLVAYAPTALSDVMKWFGGNEFARLAGEYIRGQITFPQLAHEWISNTPGDVLNNALQGISPQIKAAMIATTRKQPFPDILNQRSIADYDLKWAVLGSMTDGLTADIVRRISDSEYYPGKSISDWAQQNILQARRRDPEQWGFYATMDRVAAYQKAHGGTVDLGVNNKADAEMLGSFRRAIRAGDVPAALNFYQKLLDNGYTAERFRASIDHADPLATLKREVRKEFVAGLSPAEQEDLRNGYKYAARMQAFDHRERQLFPSEKATRDYRARYAAQGGRPDVFAGIMETFANQPEDQLELRAETLMRSALRPVKR